jgi:hypothetical protein
MNKIRRSVINETNLVYKRVFIGQQNFPESYFPVKRFTYVCTRA